MSDDMPKDLTLDLSWTGGLAFDITDGTYRWALDGDHAASPSPVQALAGALGACMGIDVVHILNKSRTPARAVSVRLTAMRAERDPRRLVSVVLAFRVEGTVPAANVERALKLSRDTYCSVWHSLARDIVLETRFELVAE